MLGIDRILAVTPLIALFSLEINQEVHFSLVGYGIVTLRSKSPKDLVNNCSKLFKYIIERLARDITLFTTEIQLTPENRT